MAPAWLLHLWKWPWKFCTNIRFPFFIAPPFSLQSAENMERSPFLRGCWVLDMVLGPRQAPTSLCVGPHQGAQRDMILRSSLGLWTSPEPDFLFLLFSIRETVKHCQFFFQVSTGPGLPWREREERRGDRRKLSRKTWLWLNSFQLPWNPIFFWTQICRQSHSWKPMSSSPS